MHSENQQIEQRNLKVSTIWHRILKLINRKSENDNSDIEPKTIGYGKSEIEEMVNRNLQNRKL